MASIIATVRALLEAIDHLVALWRSREERQAAEAIILAEAAKKDADAARRANEIDRSVRSDSLDAVRERMRQYQRD